MQARTRVLAPTDTQGKRIKVSANGKSKTYLWRGDVEDMHMWAVSAFLNDKGYSAIGQITTLRPVAFGYLYEVRDYTQLEISRVMHAAQANCEEFVRIKVVSDKEESRYLNVTPDQLARMIAVL